MAGRYSTCEVFVEKKRGVEREDDVCMLLYFFTSMSGARTEKANWWFIYIELN